MLIINLEIRKGILRYNFKKSKYKIYAANLIDSLKSWKGNFKMLDVDIFLTTISWLKISEVFKVSM